MEYYYAFQEQDLLLIPMSLTLLLVSPLRKKHVLTFPVILLEELLRAVGLFTKVLSDFLKSGTYIPTK